MNRDFAEQFLSDPRHHILAALDDGRVVGFLSAVDYIHPDKPRELFINEVGVVETHRRRGIGRRLVGEALKLARSLGCTGAWVATENENRPATRLYESVGNGVQKEDSVVFFYPLG